MSNRRFQNTSNFQKNIRFNNQNQNQNTQPLNRRQIANNFSSNSLQNTLNNQGSYINHTENSRGSPYTTTHHNNSANENPNPLMENKITPIISDTSGNRPLPRFGQSLVSISPVKLLLFGGAVGDVKNFRFSNDVYLFNLMTIIWTYIIIE